MSILRTLAARRSPLVSCQIARCAGLHQSIVRSSGKETTLHHEGRAEDIEKEKDDMLKKQNEGQGHWRESLASDSESIVKADRGEVEASEEDIKTLQKEAAKAAKTEKAKK